MSLLARAAVIFVTFGLLCGAASAESLRVVTRDGAPIGGPATRYGESFARETGIAVEVIRRPFASLYGEIMVGFVTGLSEADVLLIPSAWLPDFAPYLAPVPEVLAESDLVRGIHPIYRDALMRWQGRTMAVTIDGDLLIGAYRRDLFEDPAMRAAFHAATGRALEPPRSWEDYLAIAAFFDGRPGPDGKPLAGTLEAHAASGQRLWSLIGHAAAYATHPGEPGTLFFDPVTMTPAIDNPAWQRALDEYLAAARLGPPDSLAIASHDVRRRFAAGEAAMAIDWSDIGVLAADPENSAVAGHVGFFALPGSRESWNGRTRSWDTLSTVREVPFLAFGGWLAAVPLSARDPKAAWDYIAWLAAPEHADRDVTDGASGFNPYRTSQLEDGPLWQAVMGKDASARYLAVLRQSLAAPEAARDLRLPGYPAYMDALDTQLGRILAGEAAPAAALADAAIQWKQITDRLGRDAQARHYREAMGLGETAP